MRSLRMSPTAMVRIMVSVSMCRSRRPRRRGSTRTGSRPALAVAARTKARWLPVCMRATQPMYMEKTTISP